MDGFVRRGGFGAVAGAAMIDERDRDRPAGRLLDGFSGSADAGCDPVGVVTNASKTAEGPDTRRPAGGSSSTA